MSNRSKNVCLTGVPRSGTTLACFLLNKVADAVALDEPMRAGRLVDGRSDDAVCDEVEAFFQQMRQTLLTRGVAVSRHVEGRVPDNHVEPNCRPDGLREPIKTRGEISFAKPLSPDFLLVIKHPGAFTALLPALKERFACFAIVRNPLSVLGSWNSVNMVFRRGSGVFGSATPGLDRVLKGITDGVERQLRLLDFFYRQYRDLLPPAHIIRYEAIIESQGAALQVVTAAASSLKDPLASRNQNPVYSIDKIRALGQRLLESEGAYWEFYSRESVRALMPE